VRPELDPIWFSGPRFENWSDGAALVVPGPEVEPEEARGFHSSLERSAGQPERGLPGQAPQ
jgi:hypothetical protein